MDRLLYDVSNCNSFTKLSQRFLRHYSIELDYKINDKKGKKVLVASQPCCLDSS